MGSMDSMNMGNNMGKDIKDVAEIINRLQKGGENRHQFDDYT
jgi:hypothetical protein